MKRREELDKIIESLDENKKMLVRPMLDEIVGLEETLKKLKKYPFIEVNPKNQNQQRVTKASRLYKEMFQSYTSAIHMLLTSLSAKEIESDPVQQFLEERKNFEQ